MSSIKPVLRSDKVKPNGFAPLYIRVISNRKIKYRSVGVDIEPKHWDKLKEKVKRTHPNSMRFNNMIQEKLKEVTSSIIDLEAGDTQLGRVFEPIDHKKVKFVEYAFDYLESRKKINKLGMIRRARTVVAKVRDYLNGGDVALLSVDIKWLNNYEYYLLNTVGNSTNTVAANMSVLRTIMNAAEREGVIKPGKNPFDLYRIRKEESDIIFLTDDELERIKELELKDGSVIQRHRDMYVFACYAAGIRIGDILQLRWKNYDGERLTFTTSKTSTQLNIKLGPTALGIINSIEPGEPNESIFGFLPGGTLSEQQLLRKLSSATALINKNLRIIAKRAKVDKHIHFHTSRHTWATRMLRRGMRLEHVSKLLGHKSIRTTQIYTKIVNADLDQAIDLFND
ncbi:site-specific integrase [Flavobacteriales bacterium]|nr:site-specific integrase [Flavobacteriales bacterium]